MALALKRVGKKSERIGKHRCPATANQYERHKEKIRVVDVCHRHKSYTAKDKADGITQLRALDIWYHRGPYYRANSLDSIQDAYPVARKLVCL